MAEKAIHFHIASGALGFDGRGANVVERGMKAVGMLPTNFVDDVTTKTITYKPRPDNWLDYLRRVRLLEDGVVNAVGLINPGFAKLIMMTALMPPEQKSKTMVSVIGDTSSELITMAFNIRHLGFKGVELNVSCPNEKCELNMAGIIHSCYHLRAQLPDGEVRLKLSPIMDLGDVDELLCCIRGRISAISINSVPWKALYGNDVSPLARFGGGGVSGKAAQSLTWKFAKKLKKVTSIPIIWPSIWSVEDIDRVIDNGASHISLGSVILAHPFRADKILRYAAELASTKGDP